MIERLVGNKRTRDTASLIPIVRRINELETRFLKLRDEDFRGETARLRERLASGETLDDLLPEAFAMAREAGRRVLGERTFDVQLMGAVALHRGAITEMKTGEGKTICSVAAAYLNALTGQGVHIVTVNDYLAERDAGWMGPIYRMLGVSVGFVLSQMDTEARRQAYQCDITYGTNNELGFDYLRDNMKWDPGHQGAARSQLLHRRRDRLDPHRRGPHPADHLGRGRGRHGGLHAGQPPGDRAHRVHQGSRDRRVSRGRRQATTASTKRPSASPSPTRA